MSDLDRLFYWRGVSPEFINYRGEHTEVSVENRLKLLRAMGFDSSNPKQVSEAVYQLDVVPWHSWAAPLELVKHRKGIVCLNFHPDDLLRPFKLTLSSSNRVCEFSFIPNEYDEVGDYQDGQSRYSRRAIPIGDLEIGYYSATLLCVDVALSFQIACVPDSAYLRVNDDFDDTTDIRPDPWGFIIQLYTLRSEDNWGIGDFEDLKDLVYLAAENGADIIGLNPFHALQVDLDHNFSPYSPSDRRFLNPLYIRVQEAPGYSFSSVNIEEITELRASDNVEYTRIRDLKYSSLLQCFNLAMVEPSLKKAFLSYLQEGGEHLFAFARYEQRHNWSPDFSVHSAFSEILECLNDEEFEYNVGEEAGQRYTTLFYCYMQWVAEMQLEACHQASIDCGMRVGLVRDLAVGASRVGSEVLTNKALFCMDASIGAPPDPLALTGQNWGVPPMDPVSLKQSAYQHFIDLLRFNMTHCGALRIDHAMSLLRLWWCPPDAKADEGAYVYYPLDVLSGLLCLESHLNKCEIIAEDLGVVPEAFKDAVHSGHFFGNRVFYFEKWNDSEFKWPDQYDHHTLAMVSNHDVPTLISWWNGTDLALRNELDLLGENADLNELLAARHREKENIISQLAKSKMLPMSWQGREADSAADEDIVFTLMAYLSRAKSKYFVIQLEDLMLMDAPVNVPGTFSEHLNWSRKLKMDIHDVFNQSSVKELFTAITETRKINMRHAKV